MQRSLATVLAACVLGGCQVHAEDSGPTVSRNYQVGNFQKIEVAGPYDVEIRTGPNVSISGRGGEKLLERTEVEVSGDKLVIRPKSHHGLFNWSWGNHGSATFAVTVPQLTGVTIAGSGDIKVDKVQGQQFDGTVAGSGGLDLGAVDVQSLKLAIAGSGNVKAAAGKAQAAKYDIVGSGDVDASGVQAQQVKVSIAGAGGVKAHSSGTAGVSIAGSGDVDVSGGAKCTVKKAGSGSVRCS